jgi:hypothetical protein
LINSLLCTTSLLAPAQIKVTLELFLFKHKKPIRDFLLFYRVLNEDGAILEKAGASLLTKVMTKSTYRI